MSKNSPKPIKLALLVGLALAGSVGFVGCANAAGMDVPPPIFSHPLGASSLSTTAEVSPGNLLAPPSPPVQSAPTESVTTVTTPNPVHITKAGEELNQGLVDAHMKPVTPGFVPMPDPHIHQQTQTQANDSGPRYTPRRSNRSYSRSNSHNVENHNGSSNFNSGLVLSNTQLNVLRFPDKVIHVWFPANTPIIGSPVYFAGNHAVMLQFEPGMDQTVQIMVELANGEVLNKSAVLRAGPGATINMGDMSPSFEGQNSGQHGEPTAPDTTGMSAVRLLQAVVQGRIPSGFAPVALPAPTPFQEFEAKPVMVWANNESDLRIYAFELVSKSTQPITITPPEFYRPGVEAVLLTSNTVGGGNSPFLYIVEAFNGE